MYSVPYPSEGQGERRVKDLAFRKGPFAQILASSARLYLCTLPDFELIFEHDSALRTERRRARNRKELKARVEEVFQTEAPGESWLRGTSSEG